MQIRQQTLRQADKAESGLFWDLVSLGQLFFSENDNSACVGTLEQIIYKTGDVYLP
jgi:hypothetical protein